MSTPPFSFTSSLHLSPTSLLRSLPPSPTLGSSSLGASTSAFTLVHPPSAAPSSPPLTPGSGSSSSAFPPSVSLSPPSASSFPSFLSFVLLPRAFLLSPRAQRRSPVRSRGVRVRAARGAAASPAEGRRHPRPLPRCAAPCRPLHQLVLLPGLAAASLVRGSSTGELASSACCGAAAGPIARCLCSYSLCLALLLSCRSLCPVPLTLSQRVLLVSRARSCTLTACPNPRCCR